MKTINWTIEVPSESVSIKGELEVEHDATDEEIDEAVSQEVFNLVQWGWSAAVPTQERSEEKL